MVILDYAVFFNGELFNVFTKYLVLITTEEVNHKSCNKGRLWIKGSY